MISEEGKNSLLAKWLAGSLSKEQEEELRNQYDLDTLKKSVDHISEFSSPHYDPESEWSQLSKKISTPEKSKRQAWNIGRRMWIGMSIAATLALLVGSFFWFNKSNYITITSQDTQVVAHTLPNDSEVTLFGEGTVRYNKKTWLANRTIELKGNAFFDVTSGNPFIVNAAYGDIEVLGTRFSIVTVAGKNIVKCFEGSVQVTNPKETKVILEAGEGVEVHAEDDLQVISTVLSTAPWMTNETKFTNADIQTIGRALEEIYACEVSLESNLEKMYSGVIIHNDLENALKLICDPLGLKYDIINQKEIRIYK